MAIVLSDVYSVTRLASDLSVSPSLAGAKLVDTYHLIENLVLCEKLLFEKVRGEAWAVESFLSGFTIPIEFITFPTDWNTSISGDKAKSSELALSSFDYISQDGFFARTSDYLYQATKLGIYLSLHPSRSSYIFDDLKHTLNKKASDIIFSHTEKIMKDSQAYQYASISLSVPPVVDYVFGFAKRRHVDIATSVNEIRESAHARKFRRWCAEIDAELINATGRNSIFIIQRLLDKIDKVVSAWKVDLDEGVKHVPRKISLKKVWGIGKLIEAISFGAITIKDPILLSPGTSSLLFLNDIYRPISGGQ